MKTFLNICRVSCKKLIIYLSAFVLSAATVCAQTVSYKIVDTGQKKFYNNSTEISTPAPGENFYGQDAQFSGNEPSYKDNGDGTITDNVTGLMWQQSPDLNGDGIINYSDKLTYDQAAEGAASFNLAGYNDWRLPTIKELYSLIMFYGLDPSGLTGNIGGLQPFINTDYFAFGYGDEDAGERIIDAQFATSTLYVGTTMNNNPTMFGVNFADGRIKGYPYGQTGGAMGIKKFYVLYVRSNSNYGVNDFHDNGDGTITDAATGLMWQANDNGEGVAWEDALKWVQQKNSENFLGHNDWRLPNVKELQSIVDYSRSPQTTDSPAINQMFTCSEITDEGGYKNYPFYWSGTTHANMARGDNAAYVAFGEALGWMQDPMGGYQLMDVHGAGAQRSDPKTGDPADYPYGHGPQGDVIRIYNYVRLVRDADADVQTSVGDTGGQNVPSGYSLSQNYPNPFNPETVIEFSIPGVNAGGISSQYVSLKVYDSLGQEVTSLVEGNFSEGNYKVKFDASHYPSGVYIYAIKAGSYSKAMKMICMK